MSLISDKRGSIASIYEFQKRKTSLPETTKSRFNKQQQFTFDRQHNNTHVLSGDIKKDS